jgi:hypothetical protein
VDENATRCPSRTGQGTMLRRYHENGTYQQRLLSDERVMPVVAGVPAMAHG